MKLQPDPNEQLSPDAFAFKAGIVEYVTETTSPLALSNLSNGMNRYVWSVERRIEALEKQIAALTAKLP